jgi:signal transduction histidine kinase
VAKEKINLGDQALFFITEMPTSEAFKHINIFMLIIGVFFLFVFLGSLGLGYIVMRQIVRPMESLAATARKISNGDLDEKAESKRMDEFGELAQAFNSMTDKLVSTIDALEKEKNFVQHIIESLTHPFYVINVKDFTIRMANSAAQFELRGDKTTCYELTHHTDSPCEGVEHPCPVHEIIKTKKPVSVEHIHPVDEVTSHTIEIHGYPVFDETGEVSQVIEYNFDVSEKKNLEAQLRQAQRLESIGILTGGVAHDFNNLLTTIIGYSQLVLMKMPVESSEHDAVEAIYQAAYKASELTRQLLAFSRKQVMDIKVINLNELVNNITKILERLIGEDIEIKILLQDAIGNIKADPGQIEQVLVNLVVNAKDAMPKGGIIYLETDSVELDEEYCRTHADITPGLYIVLSVTDTGTGMTPEVKEKIFDPFFTTKKKDEGTGLGLATVYGIIKQLKGHIYVYSELENGTTFKIYFPESKEGVTEELLPQKGVMEPGSETILVVDDEKSIVRLIGDTLEPIGYTVLQVSDAEEAIKLGKDPRLKIDMLLTDVIMAKMNGKELANILAPLRPEMEILFMSGYTDNIIAQKGILTHGVNFIPKPIVPTILTNKIRSIFDRRR